MSLKIDNLSFSYNADPLLQNLNADFHNGEFITILGRNGEGKTTLFKLIIGSLKPQKGILTIDGEDLSTFSIKKRAQKIAYIPQSSNPSFSYSVFNTVLMGVTSQISSLSSPSKNDEKRVLTLLDEFGLSHLHNKKLDQISGGEKQLTLIARAILQNSKVLIFDEPTANLDYYNQILVLDRIKKLQEAGYLIILTTHTPEQALLYSSRILLLKDGKFTFSGTAEEIVESNALTNFYGKEIYITKINTGEHERFVCTLK